MKKITNLFSSIGLLLLGLFMFTSKAYADLAPFPGGGGGGRVSPGPDNSTIILIPGGGGGGRVSPGPDNSTIILIGAGVGVGVVAIVSWLVIRAIRRKKNVINK